MRCFSPNPYRSCQPRSSDSRLLTLLPGRGSAPESEKTRAKPIVNASASSASYAHNFSLVSVLSPSNRRALGTQQRASQGPESKPSSIEEATSVSAKCPRQKIRILSPLCGGNYGALVTYCYEDAQEWWFKESVSRVSDTCDPEAVIMQSKVPGKGDNPRSPCISDDVFNFNGPPAVIAPCKTVTEQIIFAGPTEALVEKCKYKNKQIIDVTVKKKSSPRTGKVTTSAGGEERHCDWVEE